MNNSSQKRLTATNEFDPDCRDCPRLSDFLDQVLVDYPDYFARPVPSFGSEQPSLLIVGLAPGMHGANRTGRPFTGDQAGVLLYQMLHEFGFATNGESISADDALELTSARITNAVKCLPPQNKPTGAEIRSCNRFLLAEIKARQPKVLLALGRIAHQAVLRSLQLKLKDWPFAHGAEHQLPDGYLLVDSYHCSRYNINTRRLTESMFRDVFKRCKQLVDLAENAELSEAQFS
ncbi:MAG: uracil-DNA glycosylase [Immundisolibacteraceae bacterium]|nr:uracil-DNA glycosylase [Immundisolibacteraceae bacterium]